MYYLRKNDKEFKPKFEFDHELMSSKSCMRIKNCDCPPIMVKLTCGCFWCQTCVVRMQIINKSDNDEDSRVRCDDHRILVKPIENVGKNDEEEIDELSWDENE